MQIWAALAFAAILAAVAGWLRHNGVLSERASNAAIVAKAQEQRNITNSGWAEYAKSENEKAAAELGDAQQLAANNARLLAKEREKNVPKSAVDGCVVNVGSVQHINAAAAGLPGVPNAGRGITFGTGAIKLDGLVGSVAENYAACRANADRQTRLIARIRAICREYNKRYGHSPAACDIDAGTTTGERQSVNRPDERGKK